MNNVQQSTTQTFLFILLLLLSISACSGGGDGDGVPPEPPPPPPPLLTQCEQTPITADQTCTLIDGRGFISYVPTTSSEYAGIAIFLHGAPGDPNKVSSIFGAKAIADQFNLISITPQGNGSDYEWNSSNNSLAVTPDIDFLTNIIDYVQGSYTFTDSKVYIFGYSAGGFMAYKLACQIPDRLTAIISLAGQYRGDFENCATATPMTIHHMHSQSDQDVPFNGRENGNIASVTDTMEFWQQKNGCGTEKTLLVQDGVTASSAKTDTEIYTSCVKSIGLSKLSLVSHEDEYIAEKLLATYEYLMN
tara:strand:+ start:2590 stop:3501 length:912 start_codon:yes stop_codon:yes gene_type:complete